MSTSTAVRTVPVVRAGQPGPALSTDVVAAERPLQVTVNGERFAVIMRTPGRDRDLAAGFLFSEQVIQDADDVDSLTVAEADAPDADEPNAYDAVHAVVRMRPSTSSTAAGLSMSTLPVARRVTTNASCGLCGRVDAASIEIDVAQAQVSWTISASTVVQLPDRLRAAQAVFDETGGLHAAGLFTRDGELRLLAEDVGRHNAVDKVIGHCLLARELPLTEAVLFVSGRTSYEILQKAALAQVPVVAAVSAPSSLAIDLADRAGLTLIGFVRGTRFNVYTHPDRIHVTFDP